MPIFFLLTIGCFFYLQSVYFWDHDKLCWHLQYDALFKNFGNQNTPCVFFRYGKARCIRKQEKELKINFLKQLSFLSAGISWEFSFDWGFKTGQSLAKIFLVCPSECAFV